MDHMITEQDQFTGYSKNIWSTGMTSNQIKWAKQHDWFEGVTEHCYIVVRGEEWEEDTRTFTSFQALRHWAGY